MTSVDSAPSPQRQVISDQGHNLAFSERQKTRATKATYDIQAVLQTVHATYTLSDLP